jgi:hypothetical protein
MKNGILRNASQDLRLRRVLWNNLNNGELASDVELVISGVSEGRVLTGSGSELETCKLDFVSVRKSGGAMVVLNQQIIINVSMKMGLIITRLVNITDEFIPFLVSSLVQLLLQNSIRNDSDFFTFSRNLSTI